MKQYIYNSLCDTGTHFTVMLYGFVFGVAYNNINIALLEGQALPAKAPPEWFITSFAPLSQAVVLMLLFSAIFLGLITEGIDAYKRRIYKTETHTP